MYIRDLITDTMAVLAFSLYFSQVNKGSREIVCHYDIRLSLTIQSRLYNPQFESWWKCTIFSLCT